MLKRSWILGMIIVVVSTELTGDHVCQIEESYPVNVTEYLLKNTTVRNYNWCMGFPPRCSFYTFKTIKVPQVVEKYETRTVKKCCPGYAENKETSGCIPCSKCYEGTCGYEGKCICNPGFRGIDCSNACDPMFWGLDCKFQCLCERGGCNPRSGRCDCPSGWFGTRCELNCLEGFYGKHCINRCNCGERERCSPETGECFGKISHHNHEDRQTTRSIQYMTNNDLLNITNILDNSQKSTPVLEKYYTFDMELNFSKTTNSPRTVKFSTTITKMKDSKSTMKNYKDFDKFSKTKIPYKKKYSGRIKENSQESTTETSEEIPPKHIEDVPIINENGSFERKLFDSSDKKDEISGEIISEIVSDIINDKNSKEDEGRNPINEERNTKIFLTNQTLFTTNSVNSENIKHSSSSTPSGENMTNTSDIVSYTTRTHFNIVDKNEIKTNGQSPTTPIHLEDFKSNGIRRNYIEEETLQNLDSSNILTSKETSTPSSDISVTTSLELSRSSEGVLPFTEILKPTKKFGDNINNDLSSVAQMEIHNSFQNEKENYLEAEEASSEFEYSSKSDKNSLAAHMTLTALISFILIAVTALLISANHYKRKKRKQETKFKVESHQNYPGGPTVSVYAHSIFHTPLPDLPNFESPISTSENNRRTFQTQYVVCNLNFANNSDEKDYTYDHPPSTGSYRAASIPEPPLSEPNNETIPLEPLYDEIPSSNKKISSPTISSPPSYKESCLYVNTCGKTKF